MPPARSFWHVTASEARGHAAILAVVLWVLAAALMLTPGPRDFLGALKGTDFVHFYTLGRVALDRDTATLYDGPALNARQRELVPASEGDDFIPAYPPQAAVAFAPFALAPYGIALALWMAATIAGYWWAVRTFWVLSGRPAGRTLVFWAAAAFPPFWNLVLHGQSTLFPLLGFAAAAVALAADRKVLAGICLGLLAIKPPFALVITLIALFAREWKLIAGAVLSLAVQAAIAALVFGSTVFADYFDTLRELPARAALLEPKPYQLHSLRALTGLAPEPFGSLVWIAGVAAVALLTYRAWTSHASVVHRMAALLAATVFVSPHLTVYDATVLAPALVAGLPLIARAGQSVAPITYGLFATFLFPTALVIWIQVSVVLLGVLTVRLTRAVASVPSAEHHPLTVAVGESPAGVGLEPRNHG